jgi:nitrous oxide reductase accessory protein NosL
MFVKTSIPLTIIVLLLCFCCISPATALAVEPIQPEAKDRCAVCGMMVTPYPNWIAAVIFKDGTHNFFDGPKDTFNFFFDLQKYRPGATSADIKEIQVTEYYTVQRYDAREVFFVSGSDVFGPMGEEFVPVAGTEALKTFIRDHGHKKVMRFDGNDLTPVDPLP